MSDRRTRWTKNCVNEETGKLMKQTNGKRMVPTDENKLDESVDGWTDGRAGEPEESRAKNQSASQPLSQPVSQSVSQSVCRSVSLSVSLSARQSVSQSANQTERQTDERSPFI